MSVQLRWAKDKGTNQVCLKDLTNTVKSSNSEKKKVIARDLVPKRKVKLVHGALASGSASEEDAEKAMKELQMMKSLIKDRGNNCYKIAMVKRARELHVRCKKNDMDQLVATFKDLQLSWFQDCSDENAEKVWQCIHGQFDSKPNELTHSELAAKRVMEQLGLAYDEENAEEWKKEQKKQRKPKARPPSSCVEAIMAQCRGHCVRLACKSGRERHGHSLVCVANHEAKMKHNLKDRWKREPGKFYPFFNIYTPSAIVLEPSRVARIERNLESSKSGWVGMEEEQKEKKTPFFGEPVSEDDDPEEENDPENGSGENGPGKENDQEDGSAGLTVFDKLISFVGEDDSLGGGETPLEAQENNLGDKPSTVGFPSEGESKKVAAGLELGLEHLHFELQDNSSRTGVGDTSRAKWLLPDAEEERVVLLKRKLALAEEKIQKNDQELSKVCPEMKCLALLVVADHKTNSFPCFVWFPTQKNGIIKRAKLFAKKEKRKDMLFATAMKDLDVKHNKEIKLLNSEVKKAQVANEKKRTTKKTAKAKASLKQNKKRKTAPAKSKTSTGGSGDKTMVMFAPFVTKTMVSLCNLSPSFSLLLLFFCSRTQKG